ncbi:nucleoside triphosphatase [Ignicoccus islandicus DSM 13165]|uniref:Nucleoside-triphosphatase EYM_06965 n=1 Tax=Ignicoccus islandicus DSM 13165 TaxID=940295 RepID=A0A0U3F382_9CREN|nr:nucleoside-triphosphatase [Ignicoccus islandicus]ALU11989.1 nucleoside triphosphatase [Ignicoccus islandicus DSM 13165]
MDCVSITGEPGSGKSTLIKEVIDILRSKGVKVCGIVCPEVRVNNKRIGFKVIDISTNKESWLAKVDGCDGPRVGRYRVCREAAELISNAFKSDCQVIAIDEIGPMELKLPGIREIFLNALKSGKPFIVVRHLKLRDEEILNILRECKEIFKEKWVQVDPMSLVNELVFENSSERPRSPTETLSRD